MANPWEKKLKQALDGPAPQAWNPNIGDYDYDEGKRTIVDANGDPLFSATNPATVDVNTLPSLPAGSNIIGSVKLSDGTDAVAVNTDGSINIIPINGSGAELFTSTNPGSVADADVLTKVTDMDTKIQGIIDGSSPAITNVSGSIVEIATNTNYNVTAGSTGDIIPDTNLNDYRELIVLIKETNSSSHQFQVGYRWKSAAFASYFNTFVEGSVISKTDWRANSRNGIEGEVVRVQVYNEDTVDHNYDIALLGVK